VRHSRRSRHARPCRVIDRAQFIYELILFVVSSMLWIANHFLFSREVCETRTTLRGRTALTVEQRVDQTDHREPSPHSSHVHAHQPPRVDGVLPARASAARRRSQNETHDEVDDKGAAPIAWCLVPAVATVLGTSSTNDRTRWRGSTHGSCTWPDRLPPAAARG
jgi:hypothetical protein